MQKFIGDAVMAVFGAPVVHEDDAERAVRAGLALLEMIEELNAIEGSVALSVRVGVNTGEVVVSLDRRTDLGEAMVLGDVVNTAARIQAHAPMNGVAVGVGTFRAVERVFEFEPLVAIKAKGKAQPVPVWRVLRPVARSGSDWNRSFTTPMVGRKTDFEFLRGSFDKTVAERSPQLVTISGEPGVGKSRLVAELYSFVDGLDTLVSWRMGHCPPYGQQGTFWPLSEIVKAHAGVFESDPPDVASAKVEAVLPETSELPWLRARLLPLLGIEAGDSAAQEEQFTAWRMFLESVAARNPTVLVFEDVHWADAALLAFLEHVAESARPVPLLIVCTTRPELDDRGVGWGRGLKNHTAINLTPLSDEDITGLVTARLDRRVLSADTLQLLLDRAGGNPLYAEEFVRMLRDGDLIDESGALRQAEVPFPDSIQALIAARLDTLSPQRKALLQDAAVLGTVFWTGGLAAMAEHDPRQVEQELDELVRKEMVRRARQSSMEGEAEYRFSHVLVRDVAYQQITRVKRAEKHLAAAIWLETTGGDQVEEIARHTSEALDLARVARSAALEASLTPRAARYALLAGERVRELDAAKALDLLDRAKALTPEHDPAFPLVLLHWAVAANDRGRLPEAVEALEQAVTRFEAVGDAAHAGQALQRLSAFRWALGEPDSIAIAERAVTLLETSPGPALVDALSRVAGSQLVSGRYAAAIEAADRALTLADEFDLDVPSIALGMRGLSRCYLGDLAGLTDCETAFDMMLAAGQGRAAASILHNLACARWVIQGPASAVATLEQALAFSASRGLAERAQIHAASCSVFLIDNGRLDDGLARAEEILPQLRESGNRLWEQDVLTGQAVAIHERGGNADALVERALEIARGTRDAAYLAFATWAAAPILIERGRITEARQLLAEVASSPDHDHSEYAHHLPRLARAAHSLDDDDLIARLAGGFPDVLPRQQHALIAVKAIQTERSGNLLGAAALYADSADRWERFGELMEQAYALVGQGRCLLAAGESGADRPLRQARALWERMGARRGIDECDRLMARADKLSS